MMAIRDILERAGRARDPALFIPGQSCEHLNPPEATALTSVADLVPAEILLLLNQGFESLGVQLPVIRMNVVEEQLPKTFFNTESCNLLPRRIQESPETLLVGSEDHLFDALHDGAVLLLAFFESAFSLLPPGDVLNERHGTMVI